MGQDYYHTPPSRPTSRGRLRQNSPRLSNLRRRLDDDPYYERQPAQFRITNPRNPKNAGSQTVKPSNGTGIGDNLNQNGLGSGPTVQPK